MVDASPIILPTTVIATLARYEAVKAVKRHLRSLGVKPRDTTARDIRVAADEYLAQHREELIAQASTTLAELFTPLCAANPFSAVWASLR
jgi:hypothetical protein